MSDLQSFIKIVWFIICGILIIILGSNDKLIGVSLIVFLGIIGFGIIKYFGNKSLVDKTKLFDTAILIAKTSCL
ncbi:hypothetical protein J4711_12985 [Staphylococcus epidermidis]|nr:hypothetical protein [Staphylococcus epidermidis]